jgi:type II secretory pathway pseudopilin PulG
MKFSSKNSGVSFVSGHTFRISRSATRNTREKAFSLAETVAALMVLAFISTSVLVVINNYMASATDSIMRMQAFEVARSNMEELLTSSSLEESVEYGTSEIYPDIEWETSVEMFYEPLNAKMWIQAICSAEYTDSEGEVQTIELAHWLTDLTKAQSLQILAQQEREQEMLAGEVIETLEEAAMYAGVDEQTIQQWVKNGMKLTEDGYYIESQLDLYSDTDGRPTIEDKRRFEGDKFDDSLPVDELPGPGDNMPPLDDLLKG